MEGRLKQSLGRVLGECVSVTENTMITRLRTEEKGRKTKRKESAGEIRLLVVRARPYSSISLSANPPSYKHVSNRLTERK